MTFFPILRRPNIKLGLALLLAIMVAVAVPAARIFAQQVSSPADARTYAMPPVEPTQFAGDLRDLPQVTYTVPRYYHMWNEFEEPQRIKPPAAGSIQTPESIPPVISLVAMPASTENFAGLGFGDSVTGGHAGAGWPPDTNGDVGPTVYIQSVNDAFGIFDKTTGSRLAAFTEDSLWNTAGTGTPCHGNNEGDPVVLHDGLADRWILTNFAFAFDNGGNPVAPFYECIAVSKTNDPVAGGWFFYAVRMDTGGTGAPPAGTLNDYPKFGLWTDCLYLSENGFNASTGDYAGAIFATFNRTAIFAGQTLSATNSSIGFLSGSSAPFTMIPANLLGTDASSLPPSGTPEYFVDQSGNATTNFLDVRKFVQGTNVCGAGSTLGAPVSVSQTQYGYPAIEDASDPSGFTSNIVGQKGTANKLDSLGDRLMQKVQYRKVGNAESLWVAHTTCGSAKDTHGVCATSTTTTRPQWAQINVTNKTIETTPVQQQIYAPDTTLYRWMGSLAVDGQGNMVLGYSTASANAFPGLAYSGRLIGDTANQLPQSETVLTAGAGSQTNMLQGEFVSRWGDYSAMSIDPADDCTFWYTNLFYDTTAHGSTGTWQTRIGAFKFPGCVSQAPTKLAFTAEPSASYASGAAIAVKVSVENASGSVIATDTSAVTLALSGGTAGAILSGTKTVNAIAGVATFSGLSVDKIGTAYKVIATDGSLASDVSTTFNITVGAAKTVTFTTQPAANSNIGAGVTIPLVAHVVDAAGNAVPGQSITLALGTNAGGSTLSVTANPVATDINGNATFANAALNKVGSGYTLTATDNTTPAATAATSNAFNIVAGAAKTVTFTTQPATNANIAAGATIPLVAHVVDAGGNAVSAQSMTLAFGSNAGGSTLFVTANPVATDTSGNATFANVSLNKSGSGYTLKATDNSTPAATVATSNAFNIVAGAARTVTFTTQPAANSNVAPGATIPLVAHVVDSNGNAVSGDSITLALGINTGGSTLFVTANPIATDGSGNAMFANVSLDQVGSGYTLSATDNTTPAATMATSNAFNIVDSPRLAFVVQPVDVGQGSAESVQVAIEDADGNIMTADNATVVSLTAPACGNPVTLGTATVVNGVASFTFRLYAAASAVNLTAANATAAGAMSATFNVNANADFLFADGFDGCRP